MRDGSSCDLANLPTLQGNTRPAAENLEYFSPCGMTLPTRASRLLNYLLKMLRLPVFLFSYVKMLLHFSIWFFGELCGQHTLKTEQRLLFSGHGRHDQCDSLKKAGRTGNAGQVYPTNHWAARLSYRWPWMHLLISSWVISCISSQWQIRWLCRGCLSLLNHPLRPHLYISWSKQ